MSSMIKAIVTKAAPQFKGTAWCATTKKFKEVSLNDYKDRYLTLFFYPFDFTFVCPTEIIKFSRSVEKFNELGCDVLGVSCDSKFTHKVWTETPVSKGGIADIKFPLLSDFTKEVSRDFGVLHEEGQMPLRGTFIIDNKGILRHSSINATDVGRNVDEYLRLVQACKYADENGEVCPAGWTPGKKTIKPADEKQTSEYWQNNLGKE
ncbi:Thioredoxin-like fold [Pseudocohnilembus persalinus]|uniref:Thioredoxin-like fold n=1 Tax=Pseudocohnilembus persalinus TaxID=266149 RepID=A0A0V0R0F4_PSEPJ|nr:Thioredoxin-like fold [Pseudocohnilembus persalinus]|eukprot:KRX07653.1 Thioredoxin-like fold [Pseudocohnilembus persalinus]